MKLHAPMFCDSSWHQTNLVFSGKASTAARNLLLVQRIELFDPNDRGVGDFFAFAVGNKIEIDFSGAKNDALDFLRLLPPTSAATGSGYFVKSSAGEILRARS